MPVISASRWDRPQPGGLASKTSLSLYKDNGGCVYQKVLIIQKLLIGPL